MGNLIEWEAPDSEVTYDQAKVYRATSQTGAYSNIVTQAIADTSYFDIDGTTSNWYKITFYKTVTAEESAYSDPIQGGTFANLCTPNDVQDAMELTFTSSTSPTRTSVVNLIKRAGDLVELDASGTTSSIKRTLCMYMTAHLISINKDIDFRVADVSIKLDKSSKYMKLYNQLKAVAGGTTHFKVANN